MRLTIDFRTMLNARRTKTHTTYDAVRLRNEERPSVFFGTPLLSLLLCFRLLSQLSK
jgi:hypothetical protein